MTKGDFAKLKELRRKLSNEYMTQCSFHLDTMESFMKAEEITSLVVSATRIWRESWILPLLDELIAKYEAKYA